MIDVKKVLLLRFIHFLIKKPLVVVSHLQINLLLIMKNQLKNFTKKLLKKIKKTVFYTFKDNLWGAELADMQLLSRFNKGIIFLLCVIDIYSKSVWTVPLTLILRTTPFGSFPDYFGFSHFLATFSSFQKEILSPLDSALYFT